ncbi:unnamed protein product [Vitrella brassicaformis CCMP3155]|uniref:Uncharacterized protein n=1 Tax=Vitrella brassicaformis (strain CCMP3155) TaxID=1169540 RepID=A0A0G4EIE1_VITBC|nr:unnamed protein product [Vitrella brassicaformis CCMP3155]|eukprot:CEL95751.1 unnamed protein product [Vitrella brassicaformis CCMP3155]
MSAAAAAGDDGWQASSAAAASDEDQRRAERERELRQTIADTPGLVDCITAFLPLHLLGLLSTTAWEHAAPTHTHLTIDSTNRNERSVWQRVPLALVTQWAKKFTQLTAITLRYPVGNVVGKALWRIDVFITVIELNTTTLRTIAFIEGVRLVKREMMTVGSRRQQRPLRQIAPLVPPPSLDSLTTITGLRFPHRALASRGWRMPSLQCVEQQGWRADELGSFISSSRSLQHVGGRLWGDGERWASVFELMPEAAAGRRGPLARLQSIGRIELRGNFDRVFHYACTTVDTLHAVLTSRGCTESLTQLVLLMSTRGEHPIRIDSRILPLLHSIESLHNSCCLPNAEIVFEASSRRLQGPTFDLSFLHADTFPSHPSLPLKMAIQAAARKATQLEYFISQHDLSHPSQAAIDIANTLTFDNVERVWVKDANGFVPPPGTPPPRHHRPPATVPKSQRAACREWSWWCGSLAQNPFDGWSSDKFPSIHNLVMRLSVPGNLESTSAAELIRDGISSVVDGVRGLKRLGLTVCGGKGVQEWLLYVTIASTDSALDIYSALGVSTARLLAEKMPRKIKEVCFETTVSPEGRRSVFEVLGVESEVDTVEVGRGWRGEVSLTDGPFDGWSSNKFPSIHNLVMHLSVPDELDPSAAAERIRDGISSIVDGVRGLKRLRLTVRGGKGVHKLLLSVTIASTDSELHIYSPLGVGTAQMLAEKMPGKVKEVKFETSVSPQDRRSVLKGLGVEREVTNVTVGDWLGQVSLADGLFDGWDSFPSIDNICMWLSVPKSLDPSAAAERIRDGISSIVDGVRGLRLLTLDVDMWGSEATRAAVEQLLPDTQVGTNCIITTHWDRLKEDRIVITCRSRGLRLSVERT